MESNIHHFMPDYDSMGRFAKEAEIIRLQGDNQKLMEMLARQCEEIKQLRHELEKEKIARLRPNEYYVYILKCKDNSYYVGISPDPLERLKKHQDGKGAKYVRSRLPAELVYQEGPMTYSEALKIEIIYKKLSHDKKKNMVEVYEVTK